ncbi:hypothetical protein [Microbulbifer sp. TRSA007]|uniref:hypothetical protein n=1 Tax=Microbulbifer sp. TRSA007 TaxID=3243384 RepID=UPI0040398749
MTRRIFLLFITIALMACSNTPYHVELDSISKKERTVIKHGEGAYYFVYTRHRFTSADDVDGFEKYYADIDRYINTNMSQHGDCKYIKETLSYYDEGGNVSVLVICKST